VDITPIPTSQPTESQTTATDVTSGEPDTEGVPSAAANEDGEETRTQALANQVFGTYFARKELDRYTEEDAKKIVDVATATAMTHTITQFKLSSITADQPATKEAIKAYKEAVKKALDPVFAITEYELQTYARATEKNDPKEFEKLKTAANAYARSIELLIAIHAPSDAGDVHLSLINAFAKMSYALSEMSKGFDDIIASYSALKVFAEGEQHVDMAFQRHKTYFVVHNIDDL
jgi:hypothetical protein